MLWSSKGEWKAFVDLCPHRFVTQKLQLLCTAALKAHKLACFDCTNACAPCKICSWSFIYSRICLSVHRKGHVCGCKSHEVATAQAMPLEATAELPGVQNAHVQYMYVLTLMTLHAGKSPFLKGECMTTPWSAHTMDGSLMALANLLSFLRYGH